MPKPMVNEFCLDSSCGYGWFVSIFFLLAGLIGVRQFSNRLIAL
jgi:hypothetical protein